MCKKGGLTQGRGGIIVGGGGVLSYHRAALKPGTSYLKFQLISFSNYATSPFNGVCVCWYALKWHVMRIKTLTEKIFRNETPSRPRTFSTSCAKHRSTQWCLIVSLVSLILRLRGIKVSHMLQMRDRNGFLLDFFTQMPPLFFEVDQDWQEEVKMAKT